MTSTRTHTPTYVEAVVPTSIWLIDTPTFARKLATDPSVTPVMMRVMGRLLSNAVGLIEDLAFREVPARLARFLCQLAERRGLRQEHGWLVPLDFSMQDIAKPARHDAAEHFLADQPVGSAKACCSARAGAACSFPSLDALKARCSPLP